MDWAAEDPFKLHWVVGSVREADARVFKRLERHSLHWFSVHVFSAAMRIYWARSDGVSGISGIQ